MQSQMIGLQSSLDRILATLQNPPPTPTYAHGTTRVDMSQHSGSSAAGVSPDANLYNPGPSSRSPTSQGRKFSPLPGFVPPPHRYGAYTIVTSDVPSDDESEDTLPRATIDAPIETQQGFANAAANASAAPAIPPA